MVSKPLVSVHVLAFNHANFIKESLESILNQITDFEYDILVCDDASTDNTSEVVYDLINNHKQGDKIKYFKHSLNIGMVNNAIFVTEKTSSKYIAICEADDYWIDNNKLQSQIDFLETNLDCSMCFHPVKCLDFINPEKSFIKSPNLTSFDAKSFFSVKDIIRLGGGAIATNSMVFKSDCISNFKEWIKIAKVGDLPLMLLLTLRGNIGFLNKVMSVYRVSNPNSWTGNYLNSLNKKLGANNSLLKFWIEFNSYTKYRYCVYVTYPILRICISNLVTMYLLAISKIRINTDSHKKS